MRSTFTPTPYPPTLPPHTSNGGAQPPLPTPSTRKNGAAYGGAYLPTPRVTRGKVCRWPYPWKRKATQGLQSSDPAARRTHGVIRLGGAQLCLGTSI